MKDANTTDKKGPENPFLSTRFFKSDDPGDPEE